MPNKNILFVSCFCIALVVALIVFTALPTHGSWGYLPEAQTHSLSRRIGSMALYHELDHPAVLSQQRQRVVLKVGAKTLRRPDAAERLPLNVSIVLDKSGSMRSQEKMQHAKQGAIDMISYLDEADIVSVVIFADQAQILVPAQRLVNKQSVIRSIQSIRAGGSTALHDGISLGRREVAKNATLGYLNRIVLLSDGMANVGPRTDRELFGVAENFMGDNMHCSTIGVGLEFNEKLLSGLAEFSGGNYYYARNGDDLPGIFEKEVKRSTTVVAKDIRIKAIAANGSRMAGVIGPATEQSIRIAETWIPFMYEDDDKYRLIEIDLPRLYEGGAQQIARLDIEYYDPITKVTQSIQVPVRVDVTNDQRLVQRRINSTVIRDSYLRRMAVSKQEAVEYARKGDYQSASRILVQTSIELEDAASRYKDQDLYRASQQNRRQSQQVLDEGEYTMELMNSDVMNINQEFWG